MIAEPFEAMYRSEQRPPWDQDHPAEFVVALERDGHIRGSVLDAGCGTGENALHLAGLGYEVTGIDGAPTAIARAREKAVKRGLQVSFELADARDLTGHADRFDTVLDVALFHVFDDERDRVRYTAALHGACRSGATVHLACFSDRNTFDAGAAPPPGFAHGVAEAELRRAFAEGWTWEGLSPRAARPPALGGREVHLWLARIRKST